MAQFAKQCDPFVTSSKEKGLVCSLGKNKLMINILVLQLEHSILIRPIKNIFFRWVESIVGAAQAGLKKNLIFFFFYFFLNLNRIFLFN